jgi:hypothetical protein
VDYRRQGLTPPDQLPCYRISVAIAVERTGRITAACGTHLAPPAGPAPQMGSASHTAAPGQAWQAWQTGQAGPAAPQWPAPGTAPSPRGPTAGSTAHTTACRRFLAPFRGPATRHLPAYLAWFVTRANLTTRRPPA